MLFLFWLFLDLIVFGCDVIDVDEKEQSHLERTRSLFMKVSFFPPFASRPVKSEIINCHC